VPEQFAFHERADHGGAVDGYKSLLRGGHGMDGARDYFFARAGFAEQQCRPTAFTEFVDQPQNLAGARRLSYQDVTGFI
jgi:hypothetical protein